MSIQESELPAQKIIDPFLYFTPPQKNDDNSNKEHKTQIIFGNIPSKSNCYKIITFKSKDASKQHASLAKTKALTQYEKDFFIQCNHYRNANIEDYFTLELKVFYPTQKSDIDNCLKVLLDCLQKIGAIKNDNKCTRIVADKFLDKNNPRIEFIIKKSM